MKIYPPVRDVFRLEKPRQSGQTISRQIDSVCSLQRSPRLIGDGLNLRVAHVQLVSADEVVSGFQECHATAAESQIESSVPRRGFVWVGQPVWQAVQRRGWTRDLEGVIVRTFDARTSSRTQLRHVADETIQRHV